MGKTLGSWLKKDFEINSDGQVRPKKEYSYKVEGKEYKIDPSFLWVQFFTKKDDSNFIIRCIPTISHAGCLVLAELHKEKVKPETFEINVITYPHENPDTLYGYATIKNADNFQSDGEVHRETLNRTMHPYACTMLRKRAEDRLITRILGLYQQGIYGTDEFSAVVDPDTIDLDKPETFKSSNKLEDTDIERAKRKNVLEDIRKFSAQLQEVSGFNTVTFCENLIGKAPEKEMSNYTFPQMQEIYKALQKEINNLK